MKTAYFAKSLVKNLALCFFAGWVLFQITYTARGGYLWKNSDIEDSTVSMMGEVLTGEAEKTVLMAGDDKADLVQVGIQEQFPGPLFSAAAHAHHIAHLVNPRLVHQRAEQLQGRTGGGGLKAAGGGNGT